MVLMAACSAPPPPVESALQGTGGINAEHQRDKPYLLLVSIDGFRWDYMDRHPTPNMDRIAAGGSKAETTATGISNPDFSESLLDSYRPLSRPSWAGGQ